jgi:hypothetical protein
MTSRIRRALVATTIAASALVIGGIGVSTAWAQSNATASPSQSQSQSSGSGSQSGSGSGSQNGANGNNCPHDGDATGSTGSSSNASFVF